MRTGVTATFARVAAIAVAVASVVLTLGAAPAPRLVAGSGQHAWFVADGVLEARSLYHLRNTDEGLMLRRAVPLAEMPVAIGAYGERAVLVFPPVEPLPAGDTPVEAAGGGTGEDVGPARSGDAWWRFRQTGVRELPSGMLAFDRLDPLPPLRLEQSDVVLGVAVFERRGAVALVRRVEGAHALYRLGDGWSSVDLPQLGAGLEPHVILAWGDDLVLVADGGGDGERRAAIFRLDGPNAGGGETQGWVRLSPDAGVVLPTEHRWFATRAGVVLAMNAMDESSRLTIDIVRDRSLVRRGVVDDLSLQGFAPATLDDALLLLAPVITAFDGAEKPPAGEESSSVRASAVLFSPTGDVVERAELSPRPPIAPHQVQLTMLFLASVTLTALLYVSRPAGEASRPFVVPEGTSVTPPARRLLAGMLDLLPGGALASLVFGDAVSWWTEPLADLIAEHGVAPIVVGLGTSAVIMAIGEAAIGTTPGKLLLRVRTVDRRGNRPSPPVAIARSFAKVMCPALAMFVVAAPAVPHPGAFGTLVVSESRRPRQPGRSGDSHGGGGADGGSDGDQGPPTRS